MANNFFFNVAACFYIYFFCLDVASCLKKYFEGYRGYLLMDE